jgi:hypothetical protein
MSPDPGEPTGFHDEDFPTGADRDLQAGDVVGTRAAVELAIVRTELGRVDTKANTLFAVCGALLAAGISVLGKLPTPAAIPGWLGTWLLAAALMVLVLAARPNLTGTFGFMAYAAAPDGQAVLNILRRDGDTVLAGDADALHHLSVMVRAKYRALQHAGTLLVTGLGAAAVAAVLTLWAR